MHYAENYLPFLTSTAFWSKKNFFEKFSFASLPNVVITKFQENIC